MVSNIGRDTSRVPLHEVVPRVVPFAIGISVSDICNFKCVYCNQSTEAGIKDARVITWDDFIKTTNQIEELVKWGKEKGGDNELKIIRFIGVGEPLVNKMLPDMIKYLSERKLTKRLEVTTNASLLTKEMADKLVDSGLTRLWISIQGLTAERYREVCGYNLNMENYIDQIKYFYEISRGKCELFIKTVNISIKSDAEERMFYDIFEPICDSASIENIIESNADVDYSEMIPEKQRNKTRYNTPIKKRYCCDTLFMYMNIHSNGKIDACGCIYPPLFIGDMNEKSLKEIWNGEYHKEVMIKHLSKRRCEIGVCSKCNSIEHQNGFSEDDLDPYLEEVLKKVEVL